MARTVSPEQRAARENEILDAAQALIYRVGYAQMTIQDMLNALQISKGAFYHYFASKQALLEAVVARMVSQMMALLQPIVDDAALPALQKLGAVFRVAAGFKFERREIMSALLEMWYADENALARDKLTRVVLEQFRDVLQPVIAQGMAEGVMRSDYPELAGLMAMHMVQSLGIEMGQVILHWDVLPEPQQQLADLAAAYTQAIELVLGMAAGAVELVDTTLFTIWGEGFAARQ